MSASDRLKKAREWFGKTQKEMAAFLGVSYRTYQNYEDGVNAPGWDACNALSNHGINVNWLITGKGSMIGTELAMPFDVLWQRIQNSTLFNLEKFACFLGTSLDRVKKAESNQLMPLDWVLMVSNAYKISTDWLLTGEGPMKRGEGTEREKAGLLAVVTDEPGEGYIRVPRYDIAASAGGGAMVHSEQVVDYLAFRPEWVRDSLRVDPRSLALIRVTGDSMEPTMTNGDLVLVDTSQRRISTDSIYVLQLLGGLLVKRVRAHVDGTVSIISDNTIYTPETVRGENLNSLNVVGRVVWYGKRA